MTSAGGPPPGTSGYPGPGGPSTGPAHAAPSGGGNGLALVHDVERRTNVLQSNLPMHVHDVAFNEDHSTLYAVGHNRIVVLEQRA